MKYRILLVEDEEAIRGLMQLFLENRDYIVFPASNGEEALTIAQEEKLDLILLDIEMPGMNGFEVCTKIREMINKPIIFISSHRRITDKIRALELGGDDYITKPFDFMELEARMKANLRRYAETRETDEQSVIRFNRLEIHLHTFECFVDQKKIDLSAREMDILIILARKPNRV